MARQPTPPDIDFVIAQGEALVSQARALVARWEQDLLKVGITPEIAARMQQGGSAQVPAPVSAPEPEAPPAQGPSLAAARRAIRRLRHV